MNNDRPERVISIDGGAARPVGVQSSMDAAIAGLEHAQGRVEVGPSVRITPREARALDIQTNGFALYSLRHGNPRLVAVDLPIGDIEYAGSIYPAVIPGGRGLRVRVTVEQWHGRPRDLLEADFYVWNPQARELLRDEWVVGDGIEKWPARDDLPDAYEVWLASGRSLRGRPGHMPIYVSEQSYRRLPV